MRIAIFHELGIGGARRSVNEFAKELKKRHSVDLFFVDEDSFKEEDIYFNNVNFFKFKSKRWESGNWKIKIYKDTIELLNLYKLHKKIAEKINKEGYDLVIVNPSKYTQAPFILRFIKSRKIYYCQETLRIVYDPHLKINKNIGNGRYYYELLNRLIRKYIDSANIKKSNIILSNSKNTKDNLKKNYGLSSIVSYLGVNVEYFKPGKLKKDIDVLFIGSDEFMDGFDLVKKSLSKLKHEVNFVSTVDIKRKDLDDGKLLNLFQRARIVICSAFDEPFGMIPLESMAVGAVVIAVDEGGYRESVIDKKNGFLVKRDSKILANKIDWVLSNPEKIEVIIKNARKYVTDGWNWEKRTQELESHL